MSSWRNARSINVLIQEVNAVAPNRNKRSDGTIGDASHQNRNSDHNPWVPPPNGGVVTAVDITHDPNGGMDSRALAEHLRKLGANGDRRVKYVISNRRIASSRQNWIWRNYTGPNPHTSHMHLSVSQYFYDDRNSWGIRQAFGTSEEEDVVSRSLNGGREDGAVHIWQRRLNQSNRTRTTLTVDGFFGPLTEQAVKEFQSVIGVSQTGVIDLTTAVQLQAHAHGEGHHT